MDPMMDARSDSNDFSIGGDHLLKDIYGGVAPTMDEGKHLSNDPRYHRGDLLEKGMFTLDPFNHNLKRLRAN